MYKPFDEVVFRFPHYPTEIMRKACCDEDKLEKIFLSTSFQEAIFYASPDLYEELLKYLENKLTLKEKKRTRNSLIRYLSRMSTRCTPFALFASCSVGKIGQKTDIKLSDKFQAHVRFDMLYLCNLAQKLEKIEDIKNAMRYFPNSTVYVKSDRLRYIEYQYNIQNRNYQLVEVSKTPYLISILEEAKKGVTIEKLISLLTIKYKVDVEIARGYIEQLIESQLLISEIDPIVMGPDFFDHILSVIERTSINSDIYTDLLSVKKLLVELNNGKARVMELCNRIEETVKKLEVSYQKKFLLQVDCIREMKQAYLGNDIIETLQDYMEFLNKITPRFDNNLLNNFIQNFSERYEEQGIPLLEALDPELGIGYPPHQVNDLDPLIAGLAIPGQAAALPQYRLTPLHYILQKKIMAFNKAKDKEIEITDEDVKHLSVNWKDLPATMGAMFQLYAKQDGSNEFLLKCSSFSGCSAANLLGRFAYCSPEMTGLVNNITEKEREIYSDYIVAEISHVPDSRVGNILARPSFRDYEIVYLANSVRKREEVIYPSDILLSIRNNQVVLRSKSMNRYILPRLSTAHNYSNNPTPVYRFLCDLQSQNIRGALYFSWGEFEQQLSYLPRVRYKNIICSPAKWGVAVKDLRPLMKEQDDAKLLEKVYAWKENLKLPRYVELADGDNKLFIDLENIHSIQTFLSVLSNRNQIVLEEWIANNCSFTKDENGNHYANECIVSFFKTNDKQK